MLSSFADGTLFGERYGAGRLRVLALHGWGRTHRDFEAALRGTDGAVALDLPGFGASAPLREPLGSMDFAQLVAPVLDEALEPVVIVGHSHGGRVALCLATIRPEQVAGVVLVAAPVLRRSTSARPSRRLSLLKALRRARLISEERVEDYRRHHGSSDYRAAQGPLRDTLVRVVNESFEAELRHLRCPVVLLYGSEDNDVPVEVAERAAAMIGVDLDSAARPAVTLKILDGVGHLVPTAAPWAITAAVERLGL